MLHKVQERIIFKHEPICFNGKPIIANCKWTFKLIRDDLMKNTEYPITLEYNEETEKDFTPLFSLNSYTKVPYNYSSVVGIPREEIFVEGEDVQLESPSLIQFAYIPTKYLCNKELRLFKDTLSAYELIKHYTDNYNKSRKAYSELTGMTYEEIDEKIRSLIAKNDKDMEDKEN